MPKAQKPKAPSKKLAKRGRPAKSQPKEVRATPVVLPETPSPNIKRGIFNPEILGGWNSESQFQCSTHNFEIREYMDWQKEAALRRAGRRPHTRSIKGDSPPPSPIPELEIIHRRTRAGPAVYHTLRKPGCDTLAKCPPVPPTPNIFRHLAYNPHRDIAVRDIVYPKKQVAETKVNPSTSKSEIQETPNDDDSIISFATTSLMYPSDSEMSQTVVSDTSTDFFQRSISPSASALSEPVFSESVPPESVFSESDFSGSVLSMSVLSGSVLAEPGPPEPVSSEPVFSETDFSESDFSGSILSISVLSGSILAEPAPPEPIILRPIFLEPTLSEPIPPEPTKADPEPLKTPLSDSYTTQRSSTDPMEWVFGNKFGKVAAKEETHKHDFITTKKFQTLQKRCQSLYDKFLEAGDCCSEIKKEAKELKTKLQRLEARAALARKKTQRVTKGRRILLERGKDTYIAYLLQHIDRLVELRRFIERLNENGVENGELSFIYSGQRSESPGFEFTTRRPRQHSFVL